MQSAKAHSTYIPSRIDSGRVDTKSVELDPGMSPAAGVVNLSNADDLRWSAIVSLAPQAKVALDIFAHNDMYLLKGSLIEQDYQFQAGAFLCRSTDKGLRAGDDGATIFIYRDRVVNSCRERTLQPAELEWHPGGVEGMAVAPLLNTYHRLMLVSWLPHTRVGFHLHPRGEEIFVLQGELIDQHGRYPAGTWLRFYPGSGHAPYTETLTLILLRNGHLSH